MSAPLQARLGIALALLIAGGCSVSVHVRSAEENRYLETWKRDWEPIIEHSELLRPTESSPGACNVGGSQMLCHDTAAKLLADFERLSHDFQGAWIPPSLKTPNEQMLRASAQMIQGLHMRISALETNDDTAWREANDLLTLATAAISRAYDDYPAGLKPLPHP